MTDDIYYRRRIVSWVAFHVRNGADLEGVLAANAKRKPPFPEQMIREAYGDGCAAVANVDRICGAGPNDRICDIAGIRIPPGE